MPHDFLDDTRSAAQGLEMGAQVFPQGVHVEALAVLVMNRDACTLKVSIESICTRDDGENSRIGCRSGGLHLAKLGDDFGPEALLFRATTFGDRRTHQDMRGRTLKLHVAPPDKAQLLTT